MIVDEYSANTDFPRTGRITHQPHLVGVSLI